MERRARRRSSAAFAVDRRGTVRGHADHDHLRVAAAGWDLGMYFLDRARSGATTSTAVDDDLGSGPGCRRRRGMRDPANVAGAACGRRSRARLWPGGRCELAVLALGAWLRKHLGGHDPDLCHRVALSGEAARGVARKTGD